MRSIVLFLMLLKATAGICQTKTTVNPLEHIGDTVTITGKIIAGSWLIHVKTKPTFLNLWDSLPNHRLILRIEPEDRNKFPIEPEKMYLDKTISVTGTVDNYKGSALIRVNDPGMIKIMDSVNTDTLAYGDKVVQKNTPTNLPDLKDTLNSALQSKWITNVTSQSFEKSVSEIRFVQKEIPLRVSPTKEAPVIADLQPGIAVSILSKSRKWSYVTVKNPDGTSSVFGFIRNRELKHLKKNRAKE